jgi:hypothetical protein
MDTSTEKQKTNIAYIKNYVEFYYKNISETSDKVDVRLTGVIGFSSVLIKFADDLDGKTSLNSILKILTCLFFLGSVICCLRGVFPKASAIEDPRVFREEMYYSNSENPEECELGISDSIMQAAESIRETVLTKAEQLQSAIWCLSLGSLTMTLNIILGALSNIPP